jgi:hypothetical protein
MAKRAAKRRPPPPPPPSFSNNGGGWFFILWQSRLRRFADALAHSHPPSAAPWKYLPAALLLAFAARALVALSGDFVIHPDEIMQYLEPAHGVVFGNGVVYWEFFYGARSWLVPGLVAACLKLFDLVGLGEPRFYIGGVKLMFCLLSLGVPLGMYLFARRHFGETAAIIALLSGALWYELAGFAHKPMTEFVATNFLVLLLAFIPREKTGVKAAWCAAFLAVLVTAIRVQYAPLALILLGIIWLRAAARARLHIIAAGVVFVFAVGAFDYLTWGNFYHSYIVNIGANLQIGRGRAGESPPYQYIVWLILASGGISLFFILLSLQNPRRYALLFLLIIAALISHAMQAHKEYRFIFAVIPLWLLIAADIGARFFIVPEDVKSNNNKKIRLAAVAVTAVVVAASFLGIGNYLPYQKRVYIAHSQETGAVNFLRDQDPAFAAYRRLAADDSLAGLWHADRPYFNTPGYYYLHHRVPFYDASSGPANLSAEELPRYVSHIVFAAGDVPPLDGFAEFSKDKLEIRKRESDEVAVRQWAHYHPAVGARPFAGIVREVIGEDKARRWKSSDGIDFAE